MDNIKGLISWSTVLRAADHFWLSRQGDGRLEAFLVRPLPFEKCCRGRIGSKANLNRLTYLMAFWRDTN